MKKGYGRNYLIPQGKAVIASESAKKVLAENLKQQAHKLAAIKAEAEKRAEALKDVVFPVGFDIAECSFTLDITENHQLFSFVGTHVFFYF